MTGRYILCLDQGGSSSRAIVFDEQGEVVCSEQEAVLTSYPDAAWVEQSPDDVLRSLQVVAERIAKKITREQRINLQCSSLITQRSSMVCCQKSTGRAVSQILSWQDTRGSRWLKKMAIDKRAVYKKTGLFPNAHFGASKMRWCLDFLPEVSELARQSDLIFAPLAAYLAAKLTGANNFLVDPANASRTLLMDIKSMGWSDDLLHLFGVSRDQLPAIVPTCYDFGEIKTGDLCLPLRLVNGDQSAAAFYSGEPKENVAYMNIGTGAFVFVESKTPVDAGGLLNSIVFSGEGEAGQQSIYVIEGTVNGAGSAVDWFKKHYEPDAAFSGIDELIHNGDTPVLFLNGVGGLGSPDWRADFTSEFVGDGNKNEKLLAVVESILFLLKRNMDSMAATGLRVDKVLVSGGLSKSRALCQHLSNLLMLPVERSDIHEASARGAAFLLLGSASWKPLLTESFCPESNPSLCERYRRWTLLMNKAIADI